MIIYLKDDLESARNLKLLLCLYELMSSLKINFAKSGMIHVVQIKSSNYAEMFDCQIGLFPTKYLRLHVVDWLPLEKRVQRD
jgi:hypothetical protein